MKGLRMLVVLMVLVALAVPAGSAMARTIGNRQASMTPSEERQGSDPGPGCSAASIKGTYGLEGYGSVGVNQLAFIGLNTFDGASQQTGYGDENIAGTIGQLKWAGPYSVGADCRGTMDWADHTHGDAPGKQTHRFIMVVVDGGREVLLLGVDTSVPGVDSSEVPEATLVFSGSLKRL